MNKRDKSLLIGFIATFLLGTLLLVIAAIGFLILINKAEAQMIPYLMAEDNSWCDVVYAGESKVLVRSDNDVFGNEQNFYADCLTQTELIQKGPLNRWHAVLALAMHKNEKINKKIVLRLFINKPVASSADYTEYNKLLQLIQSSGIKATVDLVYVDGTPVLQQI